MLLQLAFLLDITLMQTLLYLTIPGGSYDLTLRDVKLNVNSTGTTPESFLVLTGYYISAVPSQTQEGSSVALTVSVTGGDPNAAYAANVSVALPSPLKTEYSTIVSMGTSNQAGTASGQVTYPDSSFQPINSINSTTDYVGTYTVYFNQSDLFGAKPIFHMASLIQPHITEAKQ